MSGPDERSPDRVVAGRYRLERVLGRGGMGVVWLAVDTLIERRVALKELRPPTAVSGGDDSSFVERALREARNAGRLNHPGVVAVHDVIAPAGDDDGVYIVMEYVEAPTLGDVIDQEGPLPVPRVAAMGLGIVDALSAAHAMGIVHRDIKPSNVLVGAGDRVKLTDFGIALAAEDTRLTRSGVMGTHAYMAPECFDTGQAGPAADLWALGATLFHAVAGRAPFDRDTTTATLRAILFEAPPAPPCGPPLAEVITGLLTRSVEDRLTSGTARQRLQQVVAESANAPPPVDEPPTGGAGQAPWEAQATTAHRPPTAAPLTPPPAQAQAWGHTTQPGAHPPPYGTTQPAPPGGHTTRPGGQPPPPYGTTQPAPSATPPTGPGGPAGFAYSGSGPGLPRQGPPSGPPSGASWAGAPARRNNTPWLVGGVAAAAAALLLIVILASGGDDGGGGGSGANGGAPELSDTLPEDPASPGGGGASAAEQQDPAGASAGQALAQNFLDVVNGGNTDAAIDLLCPVGDTQDDVDAITDVAGDAELEIDTGTAEIVDDVVYSVDLSGSVHGESLSYGHVGVAFEDDCVVTFSAGAD